MPSIFISGGAAGIGRAVAERFLDAGWTVGAYDLVDVPYAHPNLVTGFLDVTDPESWEQALGAFTQHTGGHIDVVDNNAGILDAGRLETLSPVAIDAQVRVNCIGVTLGARAAKKYLKPGATLINMASASAIFGQPEIATYSASKFYVAGLTEALSLEWRKDKIRVVAIWPLWAKTNLANTTTTSIKRLGVHITPEQVAEVVWKVAHPSRLERGKLHYGVSKVDKLLYASARLSPRRLARVATRFIAG